MGRMPRLVDYGARFEFLREAVCAIVARDGVAALSQLSVARELGLSLPSVKRSIRSAAVLPQLGTELALRHHRQALLRLPRSERFVEHDCALDWLMTLVPTSEQELVVARAWSALATGYAPADAVVRDHLTAWHELLAGGVHAFLRTLQHHGAAALEPVEVDTEALRLAALVTGLIAARCAAAASAEEARQVLAGHLRSLGQQ